MKTSKLWNNTYIIKKKKHWMQNVVLRNTFWKDGRNASCSKWKRWSLQEMPQQNSQKHSPTLSHQLLRPALDRQALSRLWAAKRLSLAMILTFSKPPLSRVCRSSYPVTERERWVRRWWGIEEPFRTMDYIIVFTFYFNICQRHVIDAS